MTGLLPAVELERIVSLADFEPLARERMLGPAYDYVAGGSSDEVTLRESNEAWRRLRFRPRVLRDVRGVDLAGSFLGRPSALPVAIAPMAAQGLAHPEAEVAMARAAGAAGIPTCLSTSASRTLEDVAAGAIGADLLFQLYLVRDLGYSRSLVERAAAAGFRAIVFTVDLPVLGYRERDRRSGFELPAMPMVDGATPMTTEARDDIRYGGLETQYEVGLSWSAVEAVRSWTDLPVVLKGILTPEDAHLAAEAGVAGIAVSSHGARQLDRVIPTADALGPIVEAIAGRCEIWVDGGIRRGLDVAAALALGADGVLIGRPFFWALSAGGQVGVERAIAILREELELALPLLGCAAVGELSRDLIA